MDAVWIDVPEEFLAERARLGHDRKDELWEGVLHLVSPTASTLHALVAAELYVALRAIASKHDLVAFPDGIGVYEPGAAPPSWRVPDGALARRPQVSERGLEGALLAIEVLSPSDESRKKFDFYARVGLVEVWLVEPRTRQPEIYTLVEGAFQRLPPADEKHRSPLLGITLEVVDGPKLVLRDGDAAYEI